MNLKVDRLSYTEPLILFAMWGSIFAAPLFMFSNDGLMYWDNVNRSLRAVVPFFILFLVNNYILVPKFLFKKKKLSYLLIAFLTISVFVLLLNYFGDSIKLQKSPPPYEIQGPPIDKNHNIGPGTRLTPHNQPPNPFPYPPIVNSVFISILIIGFGTGLRMFVRWSLMEKEKDKLEKENVQNQLAFLRNQVSPHFFMNTLNNIHALIDIDTDEAKQSIISLSKLMRHILYDSENEQISLKKELEFISNYVGLMKLRFSEKVTIELNLPHNLPDKKIPPLLFVSFIENAFKHGISYNNKSYVIINFELLDGQLLFSVSNSSHNDHKVSKESGIGLINSRKRLSLLYSDNYSLHINNEPDSYNLILKIPL